MNDASPVSAHFVEGFVEHCLSMGLNLSETEELFAKHAHNAVIARPSVYSGFRDVIAEYSGPITKSAVARWMGPDMLALAEEARIHYGDDPLSRATRNELGLPDPSWDTVPDNVKEAAAGLSQIIDEFDYLPLNQKVLLASLFGGGLGGTVRALNPTDDDEALGRSTFNRVARGTLRGAGTGAGAAAGMAAGSDVAGRFDPGMRLPGMVMGGTLGGMAGRRLAGDVVS